MKTALLALLFTTASLIALAAPTPKEIKKLPPPTEKELSQSGQNLKDIGIAYHSFNDATGRCPNNIEDKDGKPILSWRVQLLPYVEEVALHKEFKLDEPWDSKHNKALIEKLPKVFAPIRVKAEEGETFYRGFNGADTAFETGKALRLPASFPDGTSNTILVVEAGEPCIWTKPDDLPFDLKKELPKLGGLFDGDFHVLMGDGSVHPGKSSKIDPENFKFLIIRNDSYVVDAERGLGIEKKKR